MIAFVTGVSLYFKSIKMLKYLLLIFIAAIQMASLKAQNPKGIVLLPKNVLPFKTNVKGSSAIPFESVSVDNQSFTQAYRISTLNQTANESLILKYPIEATVQKGDVLMFSFYSRSLQSKSETGESFMEIALDRFIEGKYDWPPVFERGISFGTKWTLTEMPFTASRDVAVGEMALMIKCGKFPQVFEIADITLVNYQQSIKLNDLPRSTVHYGGDAPDAAWRKVATDRIEKYRKGNLTIKVLDKNGKTVSDASVSVNMKSSAFAWGTATNSQLILDSTNADAKIYRDTLLKYFNKVVFENEMKAKNWAKFDAQKTKKAVNWFKNHDIPVRGHVMVWPSWQHSPHLVKFKNDTAALRATIFKKIQEQTTVMRGQFAEWDVVNEPYAHHNIMDSLGGKDNLLQWFRAARQNTEGVTLFLNDYTMFHTEGSGSESFYNTVKYLKENKAPIDAIGEQAHIGGTPPSIEYVIEKLNHFAELGLPIQISEFDITSEDDDFKSRYMRDFMTAVYSHPSTIGFMQWGFWAGSHWIPASALWDKDWHIKPQGQVFTELITKTWATHENGMTQKNGLYKTRAFKGNYEIVVKKGDKKVIQKAVLSSDEQTIVVKIN